MESIIWLLRSAEAVAYLQENGYRTLDDFKETCAKAKQQKCQTKKQLDQTNAAITRLNEQLHYTGRYFAYKKTYQQFLNAKNKGKFRSEHNIAISEYESARDWLKSHVMDGTLPSYEYADGQKGKFPGTAKVKELRDAQIEQRNKYRQEYNNAKQKERELSAIQNSVNALINAPTFNEQTKTKRPTDQSL